MVHTKLELDLHKTSDELDFILDALDGMHNLHFQYIRASQGLQQYTWKSPEEIVEDYLAKVFDAILKHLVETAFPEELRSRMPVDIVVTIPAVCYCIALYINNTKCQHLGVDLQGQKLYISSTDSSRIQQRCFPETDRYTASLGACGCGNLYG